MYHKLMLREVVIEDDELEQWQVEMSAAQESENQNESVEPESLELVSVVFGAGRRVYDYLCIKGSFRIGDIGLAPPSAFSPESQEVRVVGVKPISERRDDIRYKWLATPDRERVDLIEIDPSTVSGNE